MPINFKKLIEENPGNSVFSLDKIWRGRKGITKKYTLFLSPDSNAYYSRVNPVFSFEVEDNGESFSRYFNVLSLRDGVYPLLRFFFLNPVPHTADPAIIIDSKFSTLVPMAWREKILLRNLYVKEKMFPTASDDCVFLISPDKDNLPLDILRLELEKIKREIASSQTISLFFSSCIKIGEEYAEFDSSHKYSVLQMVIELFPDKKINILDWHLLQKKNMTGVKLVEVNPLKFYFSDSFLIHELLQKGAELVGLNNKLEKNGHEEEISINHGYHISPMKEYRGPIYNEKEMSEIFNHPIFAKIDPKKYTELQLTNKAFQDFCASLAREIYLKY